MHFLYAITGLLGVATALPSFISRQPNTGVFQSKKLHILPLGASITYGLRSSDGNGYRKDLRDNLGSAQVTYIGTQCDGSMSNANVEGHPGFVINQMEDVAAPNLAAKPNVVLIYVGTNDMIVGNSKAIENMRTLVSYLIKNLPESLIVVSKLFVSARPLVQKHIDNFNKQVDSLSSLGNVMVADMSSALAVKDLSDDGIHPLDGGYAKMAAVFASVLEAAESQGRIPNPVDLPASLKLCNGPGPIPVEIPSAVAPPANTLPGTAKILIQTSTASVPSQTFAAQEQTTSLYTSASTDTTLALPSLSVSAPASASTSGSGSISSAAVAVSHSPNKAITSSAASLSSSKLLAGLIVVLGMAFV